MVDRPGIRTPGPHVSRHVLYRLSYRPEVVVSSSAPFIQKCTMTSFPFFILLFKRPPQFLGRLFANKSNIVPLYESTPCVMCQTKAGNYMTCGGFLFISKKEWYAGITIISLFRNDLHQLVRYLFHLFSSLFSSCV